MANLKYKAFFGDQILKQGLINMQQIKIHICCKTSPNQIQKYKFKRAAKKERYHSRIIKGTKVLRFKCALVTGIPNVIVMTYNNR